MVRSIGGLEKNDRSHEALILRPGSRLVYGRKEDHGGSS